MVAISDEIVQRSSDLYDALYMSLIDKSQIEDINRSLFGKDNVSIVKTYFLDIVNEYIQNKPKNIKELRNRKEDTIKFSKKMNNIDKKIKKFLLENVYTSKEMAILNFRGRKIVSSLFEVYQEEINLIPKDFREKIESGIETKEQIISDYISGMTDRYAIKQYETIFGTLREP